MRRTPEGFGEGGKRRKGRGRAWGAVFSIRVGSWGEIKIRGSGRVEIGEAYGTRFGHHHVVFDPYPGPVGT